MRKPTRIALALSMMMVLATFGFAGSAMADDKKPYEELLNYIYGVDEIDKNKTHKDDKKTMYTSLGVLGDVTVTCPGINQIQTVTVYDPFGDEVATVQFYTPGKENPDGDVNIPFPVGLNEELFTDGDPDWCIGGAIGTLDANWWDDTQGANNYWDIWIRDQVWDTLDSGHPQDLDFKTAGLARMVADWETDPQGKKANPGLDAILAAPVAGDNHCIIGNGDPAAPLDVCLQYEVGTKSHSQNFNQFGFCGQGYADNATSDLQNPFDYIPAGATNVEVVKVVFIDGAAFYQFDCADPTLTGTVGPNYNMAVGIVNTVTCDPPVDLVCFFDFPVDPSSCFEDKSGIGDDQNPLNIAVPGILGTIGWSHEEDETGNKCLEQRLRPVQDVSTFDPGFLFGYDVVVKGTIPPVVGQGGPFVEIDYKSGDTDTIFYPSV